MSRAEFDAEYAISICSLFFFSSFFFRRKTQNRNNIKNDVVKRINNIFLGEEEVN